MAVGAQLRDARLKAGLSLDQVADLTRIRPAAIAAMEAGDFSSCGGDAYARMQIRSLAVLLAIDPEPLLATFDDTEASDPERIRSPQREITVPRAHKRRRSASELADLGGMDRVQQPRRRNGWIVLMVVAIIALALLFVIINTLRGDARARPAATVLPPASTSGTSAGVVTSIDPSAAVNSRVPESRADRDFDRAEPIGPVAGPAGADVVVDVVAARGRTWASVTGSDGTSLFEGLITQGEVRTFTDGESLRVVLGDAGAVDIAVNGVGQGAAGDTGSLAVLTFPAGDASS
jgi:cytoskeletal protein RodZ